MSHALERVGRGVAGTGFDVAEGAYDVAEGAYDVAEGAYDVASIFAHRRRTPIRRRSEAIRARMRLKRWARQREPNSVSGLYELDTGPYDVAGPPYDVVGDSIVHRLDFRAG